MSLVTPSLTYFPTKDKGRPLSLGYIYVGIPDADPSDLANGINQKQVSLRLEDGSTIQVPQPLRTSGGGIVTYNGNYALMLVDGDYSVLAQNRQQTQEYFIPKNEGIFDASQITLTVNGADTNVGAYLNAIMCDDYAEARALDFSQLPVGQHVQIAGFPYPWEVKTGTPPTLGLSGWHLIPDTPSGSKYLESTSLRYDMSIFSYTEAGFDDAIAYLDSLVSASGKRVTLYGNTELTLTTEKTLDPSKITLASDSMWQIVFDDSTTDFSTRYPNGRAMNWESTRGASVNIVYEQTATRAFENIKFKTSEGNETLDGARLTSTNETVSLNAAYNLRFTGFKDVLLNGPNGWGWSFFHCGANSCFQWMNITVQSNTYERYDYHGCILQNMDKGHTINNLDGKVYWHGGSLDFVQQEWDLVAGHAEVHGTHIEITNRSQPYVELTNTQGSFSQYGGLFALRDTATNTVELFTQSVDMQVDFQGVTFSSDGTDLDPMTVASKRVSHQGMKPSSATARIFRCDGYQTNSNDYQSYFYNITGAAAANLSVALNASDITVTATGVGAKTARIFIPCPDNNKKYAVEFDYDSTGVVGGTVFQAKSFVTLRADDPTNILETETITGGAADTIPTGGTGTVDTDKSFQLSNLGANYIQIQLTCANMTTSDVLILTNVKVYAYA
jgi:hypothetical protein